MNLSALTLKKLSAASGLFFGIFLVLHFVSHVSVNLSMATGNANLKAVRQVYQNPLFETCLTMAIIIHMTSNTMIYLKRQKVEAAGAHKKDGPKVDSPPHVSTELQWHRYAGYVLALSIFGHVGATRLAPMYFLGNDASSYDYGFLTTASRRFGFGFSVYLVVFAVAGAWHAAYGVRSALAILQGHSTFGKAVPLVWKALALVAALLVANAVLIIGEMYYTVKITEEEQKMHDTIYDNVL